MSWFTVINTLRKEVICENFENASRKEIIHLRSTRPSPKLYGDGNSFDFRAVIHDIEQNLETISEIELTEILNNIEICYYFLIFVCF